MKLEDKKSMTEFLKNKAETIISQGRKLLQTSKGLSDKAIQQQRKAREMIATGQTVLEIWHDCKTDNEFEERAKALFMTFN